MFNKTGFFIEFIQIYSYLLVSIYTISFFYLKCFSEKNKIPCKSTSLILPHFIDF